MSKQLSVRNHGWGWLRTDPRWGGDDAGVRSLDGAGRELFKIRVLRFDDWAIENEISRLDIVKIDVEGSELDVLKGMRNSIETFEPRIIAMEVIVGDDHMGHSEVLDFLEETGYLPMKRTEGRNMVFVRADRAEEISVC